eukprot:XP_002935375.1 PREDICTED: cell death regulator Aven [Xenopus tropicalis]
MERGRGRHRRGGGGRRRPWGERGRGGDRVGPAHSGRGYRGADRQRNEPSEPRIEDRNEAVEPQEEDEQVSLGFSRRKISSNWDRYEETEKESESESKVLQRGADYSVLLSSAGDSFTQFRFADEKDWEAETPSYKQASAVCLDPQSLVRVLQELPLHLRLNVEPELVQEVLPQELPHFKTRDILITPPVIQAPPSTGAASSTQVGMAPPEEQVSNTTRAQDSSPQLELDEELDFLLSLEAPVKEAAGVKPTNEEKECDLHGKRQELLPITDEDASSSAEKNKSVTEEDLEDWLDSMIS